MGNSIISIALPAGSYIHQVVSLDSQVTALTGTVDRIESRLGPIDNTNVKQDAQIGALIRQQVELNIISEELNKTLSDVNGSIGELNTATISERRSRHRKIRKPLLGVAFSLSS